MHDTVVMKGGRRSVRHIILADHETQISSAGAEVGTVIQERQR